MMKKQSTKIHKPYFCEDDVLYRLDLLDHNKFMFLLLSDSAMQFLDEVFKKAEYNCEFVTLYRNNKSNNKFIIYSDKHISKLFGDDVEEETTNLDNLFPEDKYNYDILKQTVDYFNRDFELGKPSLLHLNDGFNNVYKEFLNYYSIMYDINTKTDKLKDTHFSYYHIMEPIEEDTIDNNSPSCSDGPPIKTTNDIDVFDRDMFKESKPMDTYFFASDETTPFTDNFSNNVIGFDTDYNTNCKIDNSKYSIYYCSTFNFSVIIDANSILINEDDLKYYFSSTVKLELIKSICINDTNIKQCNELFNNTYIASKDLLTKNIDYYENYILKTSGDITTENIETFLNNFYDVDDNKENKVKSSELLDTIARNITRNSFIYTENKCIGIRNKISKKLLEIGLKKFRLADGYYFYGLKHKGMNASYD